MTLILIFYVAIFQRPLKNSIQNRDFPERIQNLNMKIVVQNQSMWDILNGISMLTFPTANSYMVLLVTIDHFIGGSLQSVCTTMNSC